MNANISSYLAANREAHLEQLKQFLRIPSVSVGAGHREHIDAAAAWLADALRQAGMDNAAVLPTDGHPVVYADWLHAPGQPTVLIYGHYDVQPSDPDDAWVTPAFEPDVRDGKLYARGATDDKGQLWIHVKAVEAMLAVNGKLPVNVKWCIEGEEEIASRSLHAFLEQEANRLRADAVIISDGPMQGDGRPSVLYGLRGLIGFEVTVSGPDRDLHSGLYGGGVQNPIHALVELLASLKDGDGRIAVDGFYDKVNPLTADDRRRYEELGRDEEQVKRELGVEELFGERGYSFLERTTARPTLEVHSVTGGFQGEGIKPIVPSSATAKLSCRLVDGQDPDDIFALIRKHLEMRKPPGVTLEFAPLVKGKPFLVSPDHPYIRAAARAYAEGFGAEPAFVRGGGSIPIVEAFHRKLQAPVVMLNFGLPDENLHAPNEHFSLDHFDKGIVTVCHYLEELHL